MEPKTRPWAPHFSRANVMFRKLTISFTYRIPISNLEKCKIRILWRIQKRTLKQVNATTFSKCDTNPRQKLQVSPSLPSEESNPLPKLRLKLSRPIFIDKLCQGFLGRHVDCPSSGWVLTEQLQNRQLGNDGLPAPGRRSDEHVVISVENRVENLKRIFVNFSCWFEMKSFRNFSGDLERQNEKQISFEKRPFSWTIEHNTRCQ